MIELFSNHWPELCLALFAVAAGQIGRLGQKLERGETIGWRNVWIELSMFPAFGAITGAAGAQGEWPIWTILAGGITAGWLGFSTFRLIAQLFFGAIRLIGGMRNGNGVGDILALPGPPPPPSPPPA